MRRAPEIRLLKQAQVDKLQDVQRRSARVCYNIPRTSRITTTKLLEKLEWQPLNGRRKRRRDCLSAQCAREAMTNSIVLFSVHYSTLAHGHFPGYQEVAQHAGCRLSIIASYMLQIGSPPLDRCCQPYEVATLRVIIISHWPGNRLKYFNCCIIAVIQRKVKGAGLSVDIFWMKWTSTWFNVRPSHHRVAYFSEIWNGAIFNKII